MKALITGGTSGLGSGVARQLAEYGWDVTIVGRNATRGQEIASEIAGQFIQVDVSLMSNVQKLADQIEAPLDALVLSAGSLLMRSELPLTSEGIEITFATNYLSKFALVQLLLPRMKPDTVVVMLGGNGKYAGVSTDWEVPATGFKAAFKAALATDLFALEVASRVKNLRIHTCNPGWVRTNLFRDMIFPLRYVMGFFGTPVEKGSAYITRLVLEHYQTIHWMRDEPLQFSPPLPGSDVAEALWAYSEQLISDHLTQFETV